jgi:hypothetical protein
MGIGEFLFEEDTPGLWGTVTAARCQLEMRFVLYPSFSLHLDAEIYTEVSSIEDPLGSCSTGFKC